MSLYRIIPEEAAKIYEEQILPTHCALKKGEKKKKTPFHLPHGRAACDVGYQSWPLHKAEHFKEWKGAILQ
jgi:hypothetical protein